MSERDRSTLWGATALLAAFLTGVGVGVLASDDADATSAAPAPALFDDLDLTADQRAHVDSVLAATRAETNAVLEETRLELTTIATEALDGIDPVLTPGQIERVRERIRSHGTTAVGLGADTGGMR